eukprot:scaffold168468_cov31-Tisochrysis_lutea.AAC.1
MAAGTSDRRGARELQRIRRDAPGRARVDGDQQRCSSAARTVASLSDGRAQRSLVSSSSGSQPPAGIMSRGANVLLSPLGMATVTASATLSTLHLRKASSPADTFCGVAT